MDNVFNKMAGSHSKIMSTLESIVDMQTKHAASLSELAANVAELKSSEEGASTKRRARAATMQSQNVVRSNSRGGSAGPAGGHADDSLGEVCVGDYIVLRDTDALTAGYVTSDAASFACGVQRPSTSAALNGSSQDALEYSDFVFRIFPALVYRSREEIAARKAAAEAMSGSSRDMKRRRSSSFNGSNNDEADEDFLLQERAANEDKLNEATCLEVEAGLRREPVRYGMAIQLQHAKSGLFLCCFKSAAVKDTACRRVTLLENTRPRQRGGSTVGGGGSAACHLRVLPRFKAQTEGAVCFYTHSIRLESVALTGMFLHSSPVVFDDLYDPSNESLPQTLRRPQSLELNASAKFSTFVLRQYASFLEGDEMCLKAGALTPFRLYHSQSESFLLASGNQDKNEDVGMTGRSSQRVLVPPSKQNRNRRFSSKTGASFSGNSPNEVETVEATDTATDTLALTDEAKSEEILAPLRRLPAHIPYLRLLASNASRASEEPDPTDPRNHVAKGLWVFERPHRSSGGVVEWNSAVRIRHLPSGRYLAVDTSAPFFTNHVSGGEVGWYRCYLVQDATSHRDLLEDGPFGGFADHESMLFHIGSDGGGKASGSDGSEEDLRMPLSDCNVVIEHRRDGRHNALDGTVKNLRLYLSNPDLIKPKRAYDKQGVAAGAEGKVAASAAEEEDRSLLLVFSTQRSAQDSFLLMPATTEETSMVFRVQACLPLMSAYTHRLSDTSTPISHWVSPEVVKDLSRVLLGIIEMQTRGHFDASFRNTDWVKKANGMLPAEFSALFEGEPFGLAQNTSRDLKLLDAVFAAGVAPYNRFPPPAKPFAKKAEWAHDMEGPRGLQKLVHVALQRMFLDNTVTQLYFGRRTALVVRGGHPAPWPLMEILKGQLEDPLGSAVSLGKILSANKRLLMEHGSPPLVQEFVRMIKELGPQPRLVNFFEAICSVKGVPIKNNQEMILRMLWWNEDDRKKVFLEMDAIPTAVLTKLNQKVQEYKPLNRHVGGDLRPAVSSSRQKDPKSKNTPAGYIGKDEYEAGLPPVYIRWSGHAAWQEGMPDFLFWAPEQMGTTPKGLSIVEYNGHRCVRLEELCWVLEPQRLCGSITGEDWHTYEARKQGNNGADLAERFKRQHQLANYFVNQLKLFARMCGGRSYNCIQQLELAFPYTMLLSVVESEHMPCAVRASCLDLLRVLFLDRFPQQQNCGRPNIPEQLWVYESGSEKLEDLLTETPVIRPLQLRGNVKSHVSGEDHALPAFCIFSSHKMKGNPNPLLGFETHFKFFLMRTVANQVVSSFGIGRIDHNNRSLNHLAAAAVEVIRDLLSFGFQSTYPKLKEMVGGLVRLLDGRNDVKKVDLDSVENWEHEVPDVVAFDPKSERYMLSTNSTAVTAVKKRVLDVLIAVTDFRTQFRLGKLLQLFKEQTESRSSLRELKRLHQHLVLHEGTGSHDSDLIQFFYDEFEKLFEGEEGKALDLAVLSGLPVNTILLDCLMYEDDAVHAKALELLERTYTQRRMLLEAMERVILLHRPNFAPSAQQHALEMSSPAVASIASNPMFSRRASLNNSAAAAAQNSSSVPFQHYAELNAELSYLIFLVRSTEVWGVSSRVAGPFDESKHSSILSTCERLVEFLHAPTLEVDIKDGKSKMADLTASSPMDILSGIGTGIQLGHLAGIRGSTAAAAAMERSERSSTVIMGPDDFEADGETANPVHQDILRAMNLQLSLVTALGLDYNISFLGSVCSFEEKVRSRSLIVSAVRKLVEVLVEFVKGNAENQRLVFTSVSSEVLLNGLGDLKLPPSLKSDQARLLEIAPGLNFEEVVVECLRGNPYLCSEKVPKDLVREFGRLLNTAPDCSDSPLVEFFSIFCVPEGGSRVGGEAVVRNQDMTVDVLLGQQSDKLKNLTAALMAAFGLSPEFGVSLAHPETIVSLVCCCICNGNHVNAARLQAHGITMEASVEALSSIVEENSDLLVEQKQRAFLENSYFMSLLAFLSLQASNLVIDPRLFGRDDFWRVLCEGGALVLSGIATELEEKSNVAGLRALSVFVSPVLNLFSSLLGAVKAAGSSEGALGARNAQLAGQPVDLHPLSVFKSCLRIRGVLESGDRGAKASLPKEILREEEDILASVRRLQYLLVPTSQMADEETNSAALKLQEEDDLRASVAPAMPGGAGRRRSVRKSVRDRRESVDEHESGMMMMTMVPGEAENEPPATLLRYFTECLKANPKIKQRLLARRFQFLNELEHIERATNPSHPDNHQHEEGVGEQFGAAFRNLQGNLTNLQENLTNLVGLDDDSDDDHEGNHNASDATAQAVTVTWDMLVDRISRFAKSHNFDEDESALIRSHRVMQNHLLKARSDVETVRVLKVSEMSSSQLQDYRVKQASLSGHGNATHLALTAIATHSPHLSDNAAASALTLLQELLYSGNEDVQHAVYDYIVRVDKDARFFKHLRVRLTACTQDVKERTEQLSERYVAITKEQSVEFRKANQLVTLLRTMMEGHNLLLQDLERCQPMQAADINLFKMVLHVLDLQCGSTVLLRRLGGDASVELVLGCLDYVIEACQGPCEGNQLFFVRTEPAVTAVKNILQSSFSHRVSRADVMRLKVRALSVLAAALEGRKDKHVHELLVDQMEVVVLTKFANDMRLFIDELSAPPPSPSTPKSPKAKAKSSSPMPLSAAAGSASTSLKAGMAAVEGWWMSDLDEAERRRLKDEAVLGLVALANTRTELMLVESFEKDALASKEHALASRKGPKSSSSSSMTRPKVEAEEKLMRSTVASVEVLWNDHVEFVSFPIPAETEYLSDATKENFLSKCDLSTNEKRMKELIKAEPFMTAEMQQVFTLAKRSSVYAAMHAHFTAIKMVQYALVLLLNLNVVMSSYGADKEGEAGGKKEFGFRSPYDWLTGNEKVGKDFKNSLYITLALGIPNFLGYFAIMAFMAVTEVPIIIRTIDNLAKEKRLEASSGQDVTYRDKGAFTWWGVTLVFNVVFIIQHQAAYPHDRRPALYLFLVLGINLPWTLSCVRNYIVVPDTPTTRAFAIVFDTLVTKPFFRNQMLLVFCSVNGFRDASYFTLMLLDVVNISPTIQNLVRSVTKPAPQLAIVAYLFVIMVIIYASFGMEFFENYFIYDAEYDDDADDEPNPRGCHSVVACAWLILYKGVPAGSLEEVLDVVDNRNAADFLPRVLFDLSFFVLVGIILFNVITGLMVDTFSALREEAQQREDILGNECFVCGFTRTAYDDLGMPSPSFDQHKARNHFIWNYLYFICYLKQKDETEYSGVESYVSRLLFLKSQDWLPEKTSFAAQNFGLLSHEGEDAATRELERNIGRKVDTGIRQLEGRFQGIDTALAKLQQSQQEAAAAMYSD